MPEDEPRLDLAGNPLPPLPKSTIAAQPSFGPVPPVRPAGPGPQPSSPSYSPTQQSASSYSSGADASTSGGTSALKIGLIAGGIALVVLVFVAVIALTPKHTAAPTTWTKFAAADASFSCDVPSDWTTTASPAGAKMSDGSPSTVGGVLVQQNSATIDVTTDNTTTLMAYDVVNNNGDPQSMTGGSKAEVLHKQWHKRIAAEHKGYTEKQIAGFDGQTEDARLAEWTGAGNAIGFGGSLHGYRASLTGGDKTAVVVCSCLESDWPALQPAFKRVLASFVAGEAAPPDAAAPAAP